MQRTASRPRMRPVPAMAIAITGMIQLAASSCALSFVTDEKIKQG